MQSPTNNLRRRLQMWDTGLPQQATHGDRRESSPPMLQTGELAVVPALDAAAIVEITPAEEELYASFAKLLEEAPQPIELDGVCELPNGLDRSCRTKTIGPQEVDVIYQDVLDKSDRRRSNNLGGTVHIDLDQVGRFHGVLTGQGADGFHMAVDPKFGGLLLTKLARYMARQLPQPEQRNGLSERSPSERIVPKSSLCTYRDRNGILYKGTLINVSRRDATIKARTLPELNSLITFCGRRQRKAHVIRCLETGFAALFVDPLVDQEFSADIMLTDEFPGYR